MQTKRYACKFYANTPSGPEVSKGRAFLRMPPTNKTKNTKHQNHEYQETAKTNPRSQRNKPRTKKSNFRRLKVCHRRCAMAGVSVPACLTWGDLFAKHIFKVLKRLSLLRHHGTPMMAHLQMPDILLRPISELRFWTSEGLTLAESQHLRGGIPRPTVDFPESLSQRILVWRFIDSRLKSWD